jgi:2-amino-4-hydroxy-6-hydroxymethyldihydropteridine diphosphokinase
MAAILEIEQEMGRQRVQRKGPRTIDIDILLQGDTVIDTAALKMPHPAMQQRRFVLEPLAEIAPNIVHPRFQKTIQELLNALPKGQTVRRVPSTPR